MKKLSFYFITILVLALHGCDSNMFGSLADDDNSNADLEEAKIALNDGNYAEVISLLGDDYNSSSPDAEVARTLASAYMGKAGIDLTNIIENADTDGDDSFDAIASALSLEITNQSQQSASAMLVTGAEATDPDSSRYIDFVSIINLLDNLEQAQNILEALLAYYTDNNLSPDNDDKVQLGMASALHFIMQIGASVAEVTGYNVPISKTAYQELFPEDTAWNSLLDDVAVSIDGNDEVISSLITDLMNVYEAVTVLIENVGGNEDITEEFNGFMRDLLGLDDSADEDDIEAAIQEYCGAEIADFIGDTLLDYN